MNLLEVAVAETTRQKLACLCEIHSLGRCRYDCQSAGLLTAHSGTALGPEVRGRTELSSAVNSDSRQPARD
jgi:hypothetical protein